MLNSFSLVTYNIHKGFGIGKIKFLLPQMRAALANLSPDFVLMQEVQGKHVRRSKRIVAWPDSSQTQYMADSLWPYFIYAKNAVYQSGHHGNALLSKYPMLSSENINISNISRASRGILHCRIKAAKPLHLLCIHLGLFKAERAQQCRKIIERIATLIPNDEPLVMAGDFNDWRNALSQPLFEELNIKEAFLEHKGAHAKTFPSLRPTLRVDRIYYRGVALQEVVCLQGKPWRMLSDHLPLYASFSFEQNTPP